MQKERLAINGIEKVIGNMSGVLIQLLSVAEKNRNNQHYYSCDVSDGFCKVKGCVLVADKLEQKDKLRDFIVIRVLQANSSVSKKNLTAVVIEKYGIAYDNVKKMIGNPIDYDEYVKKGKNNPQGDNLIPFQRVQKEQKNVKNHTKNEQYFQQSKTNDQNSRTNKSLQPNNIKNQKNIRGASIGSSSNSNYQSKLNLVPKNQPQPANQGVNQNQKQPKIQPNINTNTLKPKYTPIQKLQRRQSSPMAKQKKHNNQYNDIKSLYIGMENWTILVRVLMVNPIKTIITKKGSESTILTLQVGDRSGCIQCSMFGETAQKFEGSLKEDQIYQISNGVVVQSSYMGKHELRITINEHTKINLKEDDPNVPYIEDFCISITKLTEIPVGEQAKVICLIKDQGEPQSIVSKAGKPLRKKVVVLCDPEEKIEVSATIWGDKCDTKFEKFPYMVRGVLVGEFKDTRQYTIKQNLQIRLLKHHNLRKYIKDLDNIAFTNPNSNNKTRRPNIVNFQELNNSMDEIGSSGVWSEVICYINSMRYASKNFYVSCPHCKKKVIDQENATCQNCNKFYDNAKYRYILNLNVADQYDSIWITAYDETGEKLMGINAKQFSEMSQEQTQEYFRHLRYKEVKLKLVTKNDQYNNEIRKKTSVIKVMDINYAEEAKILLDKLSQLLSQ